MLKKNLVVLFAFLVVTTTANAMEENALEVDALAYAEDNGVSAEEAMRRLSIQADIGELDNILMLQNHENYAGLYIKHSPVYKIHVLFKNLKGKKNREFTGELNRRLAKTSWRSFVKIRKVDFSLADLEETQQSVSNMLSNIDVDTELDISVEKNSVLVYVLDATALEAALLDQNMSLPSNVSIQEVDALSGSETDIYGGLGISGCTSGFSVKTATGTKGIATAGHCPDHTLSYDGVRLPFVTEAFFGSYDVQWHTIGTLTADNIIRTCSLFGVTCAWRSITGTVSRNSQAVGTYVCKYGNTTGSTCGYITSKSYMPHTPSSASATFVRVSKSGTDLSSPGDSGGPWYAGNNAYGIHTDGMGNDSAYMPINYLSVLGVSVLTQ